MPRTLTCALTAFALTLGLAACSDDSGDDDAADTSAPATTDTGDTVGGDTEGGDTDDTDGGDTTTTAAEDEGPCPSATSLSILNSDGLDGELDIVTEFADVTFNQTADVVFATYEIEEDPQFGMSAPVGDPGAPDGGIIFQVSLFAGADLELAPGEYPDDDEVEPRIQFIDLYNGSERILPLGDHTVTVTEVTEEQICGEITGVGETDLQSFPYLEGTFVVPVV